ncbi:hypothetical protein LTR17_022823 [Elasticomyces elasticus]|nr:hypothetical protein LTR17_022823 [Elasticomyces elasticus]
MEDGTFILSAREQDIACVEVLEAQNLVNVTEATRESIDKLRVTSESETKSMAEANRLFDKHIGNHSIRDGMPQRRVPRGPIGQQVIPAGNTHTPLRKLAIARTLENDAKTGMCILADSDNKPGSNKPLLFGVPATLIKKTSEQLHDQLGDEVNVFFYGNNISPCVSDTAKTNVYFDKDNVAFKSYNGRQLRYNVIIIADSQLSSLHNDYTAEQLRLVRKQLRFNALIALFESWHQRQSSQPKVVATQRNCVLLS